VLIIAIIAAYTLFAEYIYIIIFLIDKILSDSTRIII